MHAARVLRYDNGRRSLHILQLQHTVHLLQNRKQLWRAGVVSVSCRMMFISSNCMCWGFVGGISRMNVGALVWAEKDFEECMTY
jgi:hypothetical protein